MDAPWAGDQPSSPPNSLSCLSKFFLHLFFHFEEGRAGADLFLLADLTIGWSHWGLVHADKTYLWLILILSIPANSMSSIRNLRRSIQQICSIYHTCLLAFFKLTSVLCLGSPNAGVVCTVITKTSVGIRRYHGKKIKCVSLGSHNWPYMYLTVSPRDQQWNLEKGVKLLRFKSHNALNFLISSSESSVPFTPVLPTMPEKRKILFELLFPD